MKNKYMCKGTYIDKASEVVRLPLTTVNPLYSRCFHYRYFSRIDTRDFINPPKVSFITYMHFAKTLRREFIKPRNISRREVPRNKDHANMKRFKVIYFLPLFSISKQNQFWNRRCKLYS